MNDSANQYIYSFVFDTDGNSSNNWVASPAFANDFFQGTDLLYECVYSSLDGWNVDVTDIRGGTQQSVSSQARVVIQGNTLLLLAPLSEFDSNLPAGRFTAFRHSGDWGQYPPYDWSADFYPPLDEPLYSAP